VVSVDLNGRGAKLIQVAVKEVAGAGDKDQALRFESAIQTVENGIGKPIDARVPVDTAVP